MLFVGQLWSANKGGVKRENDSLTFKKQRGIEEEHVTRLAELESKIDNAAAKLLLMEMRLDSQKHAGILEGILKVIGGVFPSKRLWD